MSDKLENPSSHTLNEIKKHLKAKAKSNVLICLGRLKNDTQSSKRFVKAGGLELLVQLLRFQDVKIINASLSLLANLCINSDIRDQIRDSNIASNTLWILNYLNSNENLHCRACRLLGNLSDCSWHAKAFYDAGAVHILHDVLHIKANTQTYLMAIRAVRNIWSMYDQSRDKIISCGIIKTITTIFISAGKKSNDIRYHNLAETCMKAMGAFLCGSNNDCAQQMLGENLDGFRTLNLFLETQNKLAIRCVYCLSMIAECRPPLGICDIVDTTIQLIENRATPFGEVVAMLCLFCREAVNRNRIRYRSGLQAMLELMKKEEYERYQPVLLHGLVQFVYDDVGIKIMLENGLLDILSNNVKRMAIDLPVDLDEKLIPRKRMGDRSLYKKVEIKYNRTNLGRFSLDYQQDDWSPRSTRSGSSTPPSTPPMKIFDDNDESDNNGEENYSPVCSDNEWADEEPQEEMESLKSFSSATIEETQETNKASKSEINKNVNTWTLVLLGKLSLLNDPIERLVDPTMIGPLATYIKFAKNPKASRILSRIVKNKVYLMPLIKQGFVFKAQDLSNVESYARDLSALAESGSAIGEFSSSLCQQEPHRFIIAVSIPFLIKSKKQLYYLLNTYGALPLIFDVLSDCQHQLHKEAILSICHLADSLNIRPKVHDRNQLSDSSFAYFDTSLNCNVDNPVKPSIVTFELDDGTTVDACRRVLCQRSDAFSAMLEGSFSESGKRRVRLRNTSKDSLMTLLLAVNGLDFDDHQIEDLLDAVLLADKFLMADISEQLTESSMSKLNYENFCRAWTWARNNSCHELKTYCIKTFLTNKMTKTERLRAFKDFTMNDKFKEFLEEIKEIITAVLIKP